MAVTFDITTIGTDLLPTASTARSLATNRVLELRAPNAGELLAFPTALSVLVYLGVSNASERAISFASATALATLKTAVNAV